MDVRVLAKACMLTPNLDLRDLGSLLLLEVTQPLLFLISWLVVG